VVRHPAVLDEPTCRRKVPGSHPEYANGRIRHGLSGAPRRPTQGPRRLRNKIRSRAVPKTESPAWEVRRNLRDKRQDPLLRANGPAPRRDADPGTAGPGTHEFSSVPRPGSMAARPQAGGSKSSEASPNKAVKGKPATVRLRCGAETSCHRPGRSQRSVGELAAGKPPVRGLPSAKCQ
jgi:hypothetical protein